MMTPEQETILMQMDMRTKRIENVLRGDDKFKIRGLVDKVEYHQTKISEFEKDKTKVIAGATVFGAIAGFLSTLIHKIFW